GLSEGTWYFSVQAEDDNGLMSPPSDLVSKTFQR
ncbi:fibronectin type III domain-containing protein, partial [Marinobacter confluentis]